MNTESLVKLLILFGTLYLFINCLNQRENFNIKKYDIKKPAQLTILDFNGVNYYFVSLEQFKPEHQKKIINYIAKNMPNLLDTKVPVDRFTPMPMFLVRSIDLEDYILKDATNDVSNFYMIELNKKITFIPKFKNKRTSDQYVYTEPKYNMICYSPILIEPLMMHINEYDDILPNSIKPIQIDNLNLFSFNMSGKKNIKHLIKQ